LEKARAHYDRGLKLYEEEDYKTALTEFERAYQIAPTPKILYNMARIQRHQNNYVAALTNFQRYLSEATGSVPADRKAEVDKEIAVLRQRVASVNVTVNVPEAEVFVDDVPVCAGMTATGCVGKTPLPAPILVNSGRVKISATKSGFAAASQSVTVAGGDQISVSLDLQDISEKPADPGPRNRALVAWGVTALFTGGAIATGVVALSASSKLDQEETVLNPDPQLLRDQSDKMNTFATATNILGGLAIVSAGFATYFTVKALQAKRGGEQTSPAPAAAKVRFDVGPTGGVLSGTF
jgi:hypothetical protein